MLNQVKVPREMPPPKHAYGLAMNIWCVWASRRNLSNMFTMPVSVPTFQISVNNANFSLNHLSKDLIIFHVSLGCRLCFMIIHILFHWRTLLTIANFHFGVRLMSHQRLST